MIARRTSQTSLNGPISADTVSDREKGFRTSVRTSMGGSRDRQAWAELKDSIHTGDPY